MFSKFFSTQYLFGPDIGVMTRSDHFIYYFGWALLLAAVAFYFYGRSRSAAPQKKLARRWLNFFRAIGLLFIFWYALRYEIVPYFSTHIVAVLIGLLGLYWLALNLLYQFKGYRVEKQEFEKEQLKQKYL